MRLCHTSDWHLGHALRDVGREREHAAFLAWLIDTLAAERCDALVITGDVYDSSIPPAAAEALWFGFLAAVRARMPELVVIAIAGNHDSPSRLGASGPLCEAIGVHVVTALPRLADGALDVDRLLIDAGGALVIAVPFLRAADLAPGVEVGVAVRSIYGEAVAAARTRRRPGQALVATGHLYLTGGQAAWLSERRVLLGGVEALEGDMFGDELAYVALGHLHKAQRVGRDHVRYAGSPIPLAMDEAGYNHQIVIVDLDGDRPAEIRSIPVPRTIEMLRVPRSGAAPLDEVLAQLAALPARDPDQRSRPPAVPRDRGRARPARPAAARADRGGARRQVAAADQARGRAHRRRRRARRPGRGPRARRSRSARRPARALAPAPRRRRARRRARRVRPPVEEVRT